MAFTISGVAIQPVGSIFNFTFTGNETVTINFPLNFGSLITQTGTLNADDQNNDGFIQRDETVDHDNPNFFGDPIPDLNNARVLAVGQMGGFLSGAVVQYPVILVRSGTSLYLLYPNGRPGFFTNIFGTINTTVTFFPAGRIGPDGTLSICFARGTKIATADGERLIEDLSTGDMVQTVDNGLQPIRWIGSRTITASELDEKQELRPVRIDQGALGGGLPTQDLLVSPQHRVLVRSKIAERMFGAIEVLVAAKQLCEIDGIEVAQDVAEVEYFHMLFDRHEVVISNGAATEALFTGPEGLRGVSAEALEEILTILPEVRAATYTPTPARDLVAGRRGRQLAARHVQNCRELVQ